MIHNDYIMKMIAQLAKAMQQILSLRASGREDDAMREIDLTMQRIVGLNSQLVNTLSPESLRETLRGGTDLDVGKALVIGDLLMQEGEILRERGQDEEADERYFRALFLYGESFAEELKLDASEYVEKVSRALFELNDYALPAELRRNAVHFYETAGKYAAAEDVVFDMIEDEEDSEEAVEFGKAFYERLLERSDEELAKGNLPRDEVLDGLARLATS